MQQKVLVTGTSVRAELLQPLVDAGFIIDNPTHLLSEAELAEALKTSAAYLLGGDEFATRTALATASGLKVIAFLGMGYESFIDVKAASEFKIPVTNTPGTLSNSVAEFTIGLLLNSTRRLHAYASDFAQQSSGKEEKQHDLAALHVGIVGLGGIGTRIAEILRSGFGTKVTYFSRTRKPDQEKRLGIAYASLEELVPAVDALVIMTPGSDATKGLLSRDLLATAKPGLLLVNTARPEIVDPEALRLGLQSGHIAYAALDGFYDEKTVADALRPFQPTRLMVTGHIASLTHEARDGMAIKAVRSIINLVQTGQDALVVNR